MTNLKISLIKKCLILYTIIYDKWYILYNISLYDYMNKWFAFDKIITVKMCNYYKLLNIYL